MEYNRNQVPQFKIKPGYPIVAVVVIIVVILAFQMYKTVPPGYVGVASLFGKVQQTSYEEGLHFPVNPLYKWELFDARQKTLLEKAAVPSQDQLRTDVEVSVQYRINGEMAPKIWQDTGTAEQAISVHMVPKLRSILREQGKSIKRAEDFFMDEVQGKLQSKLTEDLKEFLTPKGIIVEEVLLRDIKLPEFILRAIEAKKEREQEVEKQKAELDRFKTEQEQVVVEAQAEKDAASLEAEKVKMLADAKAYEIEKINDAIQQNPAYIQLEALKTLADISNDPASKIYFINGDSPMPVPLMHIGEQQDKLKVKATSEK